MNISCKPCAFENQSLINHIQGCLKYLKEFVAKNKNYLSVVVNRLNSAFDSNPISKKDVKEILKLCVAMHDLGKAYRFYQERFSNNCFCSGKCNFSYHEVLSAMSCVKLAKELWEEIYHPKTIFLILPVLDHHNTMRNTLEKIVYRDPKFEEVILKIYKTGFCEEVDRLNEIYDQLGINLKVLISSENELKELEDICYEYLKKEFNKNRGWIKLYNLFLFPVSLCDILDAKERSGKGNPLLIKEFEEVLR